MDYLYLLPAVILLVLLLAACREEIDKPVKIKVYLRPFYKAIKKLCRLPVIRDKFRKQVLVVAESLSDFFIRKQALVEAEDKVYKSMSQCLLIIMICSILAFLAEISESENYFSSLMRNETGKGQAVYEIEAEIKGEKQSFPVTLEEKQYTQAELTKLFDYACENIEAWILGANKSVKEIEEDLVLIEQVPDTAINISWECSDYSIIQPSGQLIRENISKEGEKVRLVAVFSYMKEERKHEIELFVRRKSYEGIDKSFNELKETIRIEESESRTEADYKLPDEVSGMEINYSKPKEYRALIILMLGIVVALLLPLREKSVADKDKELKNRKMLLEYPELVCKLSLYLGAGMNITKAWEKIALIYIKSLSKDHSKNLINEQIIYTYRQLQSGTLTSKAFEAFGNRCGLQVFKKLSLLINSNLKKGSADLSMILKTEAKEAYETRKTELIKLASSASAKLMLPMVLELMVVIGVLIVPAFLTLEV